MFYPAIRATMGDWKYYLVRMKMRDVAKDVQFAAEIHDDRTLSQAIQRALNETRVRTAIAKFLQDRPDRFFSSIVVAAVKGDPHWFSVDLDPDIVHPMLASQKRLRDSFGVLMFGEDPNYYALDGQHRVAAIKRLLDADAREHDRQTKPPNFENEELSVLVVLREDHQGTEEEWLRRYRRLFSSLNRYAKPTDRDTDIIMDEDDVFAVLTRRLITDHPHFRYSGRELDSLRVKMKGKNLRSGAPHFTTLQTLYAMNEILLVTRAREFNFGWRRQGGKPKKKGAPDLTIRPDEDFIEELYDELANYWTAIVRAFPEMAEDATDKRQHDQESEGNDLLYFWPIGQELLVEAVRAVWDDRFPRTGSSDVDAMSAALHRLTQVPWDLFARPWRHLLLIKPSGEGRAWKMRSEERKKVLAVGQRLVRWLVGIDPEGEELAEKWGWFLHRPPPSEVVKAWWGEIEELRMRILESDTTS